MNVMAYALKCLPFNFWCEAGSGCAEGAVGHCQLRRISIWAWTAAASPGSHIFNWRPDVLQLTHGEKFPWQVGTSLLSLAELSGTVLIVLPHPHPLPTIENQPQEHRDLKKHTCKYNWIVFVYILSLFLLRLKEASHPQKLCRSLSSYGEARLFITLFRHD